MSPQSSALPRCWLTQARRDRPIASLESLYGRQQFKPFLDAGAVDVAIVDILWNGCWESLKIAAMCDAYEVRSSHSNARQAIHPLSSRFLPPASS